MTTRNRVILQMLLVPQLLKIFPVFYGSKEPFPSYIKTSLFSFNLSQINSVDHRPSYAFKNNFIDMI